MITAENYYQQIRNVDIESLPQILIKGHQFVDKATKGGSDWNPYHSSETIKKVVDSYFQKVEPYFTVSVPEPESQKYFEHHQENPVSTNRKIKETAKPKKEKQIPERLSEGTPVEKLSDSVKLIKRYAGMHGKTKTKEQILSFVNSLQKAILERRIRKSDPYSKEIEQMQAVLVHAYNKMGKTVEVQIDSVRLEKLHEIAGREIQMFSIFLLKRYVGLHGKAGVKDKAKTLLKAVEHALHNGHVTETDKYYELIVEMKQRLDVFVKSSTGVLKIEEAELNGLAGFGILPELAAAATGVLTAKIVEAMTKRKNGLSGVAVMNSENLATSYFPTIGLQEPWLKLIGDPNPGFSMLLYGAPKSGKSTLALQFAKHLAEHHGSVLYWSREEGFGYTMQEKIKRLQTEHPRLFISEELPLNLSAYKFVVIDSITKAGMDHRDMANLKHSNPGVSFIFIAQSTKDGNFRGSRDLEHEVDVIVKVEDGIATSNGRFNQGGRMKVVFG